MSATRSTRSTRLAWPRIRRRRGIPRPSGLILVLVASLLVILGAGWLWVRDSSLVAVKRVQVTGLTGPDVAQIRGALRSAALEMTTLDVSIGRLRDAVERYPQVVSISVSTHFPHGIAVHVDEEVPVATMSVGGSSVAVTSSGVLLNDRRHIAGHLPRLALQIAPGPARLEQPGTLAVLRVLGAAPYALLGHIGQAHDGSAHGVVVEFRDGLDVYFGAPSQLAEKWAATLAVLSNSSSAGAQYIDVTDPQRPAAGVPTSSTSPTATTAAAPTEQPSTSG